MRGIFLFFFFLGKEKLGFFKERKSWARREGERAGFANSRAATAAFLSQVKLNPILLYFTKFKFDFLSQVKLNQILFKRFYQI